MNRALIALLLAASTFALIPCSRALARAPFETNEVRSENSPAWLTDSKVNTVVSRVQNILEWDIRRIRLIWHTDAQEFQSSHGFGPSVLAFARKSENSVHMGPEVTRENFEPTFGHELTHVILFQKYKDSIPKWLEEGLANWVGKKGRVDYAWLASQPAKDVTTLSHPFKGLQAGSDPAKYHYQASTALAEMIASRCDLRDLLHLSVGSKLTRYLATTCGIQDINAEYTKWVKRKASASH